MCVYIFSELAQSYGKVWKAEKGRLTSQEDGLSYPCVCYKSFQFSSAVMSNSSRPHGLQHARLPCPSPTPGALLCPILCNPMYHSPPGSSVLGYSPGKNAGVGCHPTPEIKSISHYVSCIGRQVLYHSHHLGSPLEEGNLERLTLLLQIILGVVSDILSPAASSSAYSPACLWSGLFGSLFFVSVLLFW